MLYLTDTLPKFCPACGVSHSDEWMAANGDDFEAGATLQCDCGAACQFLPVKLLVDASKQTEGGDLYRFANV